MTNPIEIIKKDHRKVEALFKEYEDIEDGAFDTKKEKVEEIIRELKLHTEMEEKLLYPVLKEAFSDEDDKMVEEGYAEHDVAKRILEELSVIHPEDPQFDAKVKVLNENITHHVMEEEKELLPRAEEKLTDEEMDTIGENLKAFKVENALAEE
jgi:hemerythrin-like domain-containing protein